MPDNVKRVERDGKGYSVLQLTDSVGREREIEVCSECLMPMPDVECSICHQMLCDECLPDAAQGCKDCGAAL